MKKLCWREKFLETIANRSWTKTRSQKGGWEIDEGFVEDFEREKLKRRVIGFTRGCYSINNAQQREESKSRGRRGEGRKKPRNRATGGKFQPCGKTELTTRIVKKELKKKGEGKKGLKRGEGKKKEESSCRKAGKGGIKAFSRPTLAVGEIEIF